RVTGAEGEEEVGGVPVGLRREDRIGGAGGVECGARTERVELADHRPRQGLEPGRGGDEHAPAREAMGTAAEQLALAHAGDRTLGQGPDAVEHGDRRRATDAVGGEVHVALELDQRARRVVAQDAVLASGVEPEAVQPALQLGDVVAAQHGTGPVEESVAEAPAALDHRGPGLWTADAVDPEPAALLEGAHGALGLVTERSGLDARDLVTQRAEPNLEVTHRLATASRPQHGRVAQAMNSARSWSS